MLVQFKIFPSHDICMVASERMAFSLNDNEVQNLPWYFIALVVNKVSTRLNWKIF